MDKDHHMVAIGLVKAKQFLDDKYLKEIQCTSDQRYFCFKNKCCHSFRKNNSSHTLKIALCIIYGGARSACCFCITGKVGFCNHALALMFKLRKFSLLNYASTKDLLEEEDSHAHLNCSNGVRKVGV